MLKLIGFLQETIGMVELINNLKNLIFSQLIIKTLQIINKIIFWLLEFFNFLLFHIEPFNRTWDLF